MYSFYRSKHGSFAMKKGESLSVFANKIMKESKCQNQSPDQMEHHGLETTNPYILDIYGTGELSFFVNKLSVHSNPPIKP